MVAQVYGEIGQDRIIFTQNEQGLWESITPALQSGRYILSLYAVDEAGNESYYATAIYTIDTEQITARLEIIEYAAGVRELIDAEIFMVEYGAQITDFGVIA